MRNELKVSDIIPDYMPTGITIFSKDTEMEALKEIVMRLPEYERNIILTYSEVASLKKLSEMLGVSKALTHKIIVGIQSKIKNEYSDRFGNDMPMLCDGD